MHGESHLNDVKTQITATNVLYQAKVFLAMRKEDDEEYVRLLRRRTSRAMSNICAHIHWMSSRSSARETTRTNPTFYDNIMKPEEVCSHLESLFLVLFT